MYYVSHLANRTPLCSYYKISPSSRFFSLASLLCCSASYYIHHRQDLKQLNTTRLERKCFFCRKGGSVAVIVKNCANYPTVEQLLYVCLRRMFVCAMIRITPGKLGHELQKSFTEHKKKQPANREEMKLIFRRQLCEFLHNLIPIVTVIDQLKINSFSAVFFTIMPRLFTRYSFL